MDPALQPRPTSGASPAQLVAQLDETRRRTLALVEDLSPAELMGKRLDIVNPILWEIGHIGWFHEFWTLRHIHAEPSFVADGDRLWDSSAVPHATRWSLPLPDLTATLAYLETVLRRQQHQLRQHGPGDGDRYFYDLAIRHEDMHVEALAYTRQTLGYPAPKGLGSAAPKLVGPWPGDASVPAGCWWLGAGAADGFVFDNEKWAHALTLEPFRIAKAPVTNAAFARFVEAGGYRTEAYWSDPGWAWRVASSVERPLYWLPKTDGIWRWRRYDAAEALRPDAPIVFVNWYEADAWCRWAKRRLPSEAEWEAAALGEPALSGGLAERKRRWPWGDDPPSPRVANLDFAADAPFDVAACPDGDSSFGCRQMIGNVWEWTQSDFLPYPGFVPDPYRDYSEPWFGTRKVLRGGCWATSRRIARPAYRNFFTPDRRDVFAGFRSCAL